MIIAAMLTIMEVSLRVQIDATDAILSCPHLISEHISCLDRRDHMLHNSTGCRVQFYGLGWLRVIQGGLGFK